MPRFPVDGRENRMAILYKISRSSQSLQLDACERMRTGYVSNYGMGRVLACTPAREQLRADGFVPVIAEASPGTQKLRTSSCHEIDRERHGHSPSRFAGLSIGGRFAPGSCSIFEILGPPAVKFLEHLGVIYQAVLNP